MAFTFWYLSLACCDINLFVFSICLFLVARRLVLLYSSLDSSVTFAERFNSDKTVQWTLSPKVVCSEQAFLRLSLTMCCGCIVGRRENWLSSSSEGNPFSGRMLWSTMLSFPKDPIPLKPSQCVKPWKYCCSPAFYSAHKTLGSLWCLLHPSSLLPFHPLLLKYMCLKRCHMFSVSDVPDAKILT